MPLTLSRSHAVIRLKHLAEVGTDLRPLADEFGITVFTKEGKFQKGWAGHVCEALLGQMPNSYHGPDFIDPDTGPWELKAIPMKQTKRVLVPKETMAITMIKPQVLVDTEFYESILYKKLQSFVLVGRRFYNTSETTAPLLSAAAIDLKAAMMEQIKADYDLVRATVAAYADPMDGLKALSGKMGIYVQPRTKGPGHGSVSRAFYLRTAALKMLLEPAPAVPAAGS